MAKSVILLTHDESAADMAGILQGVAGNKMLSINKVMAYFQGVAGGIRKAKVQVGVAAVQASGTITFSGAGQANDTIIINGVTFTAKASGASGDEWNVGADEAASAAACAAAINASATALVAGYVTAEAAAGVVTITAVRPGTLGNCITLAEGVDGLTHMAVSGARLTGGTDGTEVTTYYGGAT